MEKRRYGLLTAITMITGIVIGSGIFFKADDVLTYTKGNVLLGVIIFAVAAIAIVFGCLAISSLANLTDKPGGLIAYMEEFVGIGPSCSLGWFQTFLYYPTLCAVVSWVSGIYICILFGINNTLENQIIIGFLCMTVLFIFNVLSAKLGGYFQNASMLIKLIPLILIALTGLFFGDTANMTVESIQSFKQATSSFGWIAAFAPIAFSFDGWIVSTSISNEIKNSKRNLPLALAISPLIILIAYVAYFVGISSLLGTDQVLELGNDSAFAAANIVFGHVGAKLILTFVVISVLGTVNGLVLGFIRMPYSLAVRNMVPASKSLKKEHEKLGGIPVNSALLAFVLSLIWLVIHYMTQRGNMKGDVSEIAIGVSYLGYILLYFAVMRLAKHGIIKGKIKGYIVPILATMGSLVIISGSITHPLFPYYFLICLLIIVSGIIYYFINRRNII